MDESLAGFPFSSFWGGGALRSQALTSVDSEVHQYLSFQKEIRDQDEPATNRKSYFVLGVPWLQLSTSSVFQPALPSTKTPLERLAWIRFLEIFLIPCFWEFPTRIGMPPSKLQISKIKTPKEKHESKILPSPLVTPFPMPGQPSDMQALSIHSISSLHLPEIQQYISFLRPSLLPR